MICALCLEPIKVNQPGAVLWAPPYGSAHQTCANKRWPRYLA